MHTRIFGQFSVILMLLSLMGFKEYMDRSGKFITEQEADDRVESMRLAREELLARLHKEKEAKHFLQGRRDASAAKKRAAESEATVPMPLPEAAITDSIKV